MISISKNFSILRVVTYLLRFSDIVLVTEY